jgi:hypothetical protein
MKNNFAFANKGKRPLSSTKIHPMVARLIDPAVLEKLKGAAVEPVIAKRDAAIGNTEGNA